jgi:WXG100 family type VII secretion target
MSTTWGGIVYNVTPEYLTQASSDCVTTATEVSAQLLALKNYVVSLEDSWQGIAADQFQTLMQSYDANSTSLVNVLEQIGNGLNNTGQNYSAAEAQAAANVAAIDLPPAKLG